MREVSAHNKSILAGYKLKPEAKTKKLYVGKIDGKEARAPRGPQKLIGQGMEQLNVYISSDDMNALEDLAKDCKKKKPEIIREWIREKCAPYYMEVE